MCSGYKVFETSATGGNAPLINPNPNSLESWTLCLKLRFYLKFAMKECITLKNLVIGLTEEEKVTIPTIFNFILIKSAGAKTLIFSLLF